MLRQVQSDRSNLAHGWLPFAADSITAVWHSDAARGPSTPSFNYLIGAGEQAIGHCEAERSRGLEVDNKHEFRGLLDWKVSRVCAGKDSGDVSRSAAIEVAGIGTIGHQATLIDVFAPFVHHG